MHDRRGWFFLPLHIFGTFTINFHTTIELSASVMNFTLYSTSDSIVKFEMKQTKRKSTWRLLLRALMRMDPGQGITWLLVLRFIANWEDGCRSSFDFVWEMKHKVFCGRGVLCMRIWNDCRKQHLGIVGDNMTTYSRFGLSRILRVVAFRF